MDEPVIIVALIAAGVLFVFGRLFPKSGLGKTVMVVSRCVVGIIAFVAFCALGVLVIIVLLTTVYGGFDHASTLGWPWFVPVYLFVMVTILFGALFVGPWAAKRSKILLP